MVTELETLQAQVRHLERRLSVYHERLEECLEHDRKFQLQATWGVVNTALGAGAYAGTIYIAEKWLKVEGWGWEALAGLVALAVFAAVFIWSDRGRERDVRKLSRLPSWDAQ